jgi:membrane protease YdiL (CAAX protease family)
MDFFRKEFSAIGLFLARNKSEVIVISSAMLFLSLGEYHPLANQWFSDLIYYALLPVLVIVLFLRKNVMDFGFKLGDVRRWAAYVGITCLIGAPILFATSRMASFQGYYDKLQFSFISYVLTSCVGLFASEFLFRGFLIFGLKDRFKEGSILVQMVPFVIVHFGKPELETISTILTGIYFGFIVYRTNSFWPALLIHLFINIFFVASVNLIG